MDFINAVILGIVEGITEFLPVSSTGHLILANQIVKFQNTNEHFLQMFDIVIQLGAILSVIVYFWDKIFPFSPRKTPEERKNTWETIFKSFAGVIPAIVIGAIFGKKIEDKLFHPAVVAGALLIGGIILILVEMKKKQPKIHSIKELTYKTAIAIGLIQCLAMIPGTSRSAATIIGALFLGLSRESAVEFSFFLSIPTMIAASGYSMFKAGFHLAGHEWAILGTGFLVSFLVAWVAVAVLMNYIRRHDFKPFGAYRIILGAVIIVLMYFGVLNKV